MGEYVSYNKLAAKIRVKDGINACIGILFKRIGLPDTYVHEVGSHEWLLEKYGFSAKSIAHTTEDLLKCRQ